MVDLTVTPSAVYGTHGRAFYDPVRDTTIPGVTTNPLFLQWVLLATQYSILGATAANDPGILARRTHTYSLMRKAVRNVRTRYSGDTIIGLTVAGIAEARCGQVSEGMNHLAAVRRLIDARGGLTAMQDMPFDRIVIILAAFVNLGSGPEAFLNRHFLSSRLEYIVAGLLDLQHFNASVLRGQRRSESTHVKTLTGATYWKYRRQTLQAWDGLRSFISPFPAEASQGEKRCHIAILWFLNEIMRDLHNSAKDSISFLDSLGRNIRSGSIRGASDPFRITLKPITIIYLIAECATKHGPIVDSPTGLIRSSVQRMFDAVDVIELLQLAPESQKWVVVLLSDWLLRDTYHIQSAELNLSYHLDELVEEVQSSLQKA